MNALATPGAAALAHIPHLPPAPVVGHTLEFLRDPYDLYRRSEDAHGRLFKVKLLGRWRIALVGADAMELVLGDAGKLFSSHEGWDMLQTLFPGGLMLRDFEDHRVHRRIMQSAFRKPVMDAYRARMDALLDPMLTAWPVDRPLAFYAAIKDLTLRVGAAVFMGLDPDDPQAPALNRAFRQEVAASLGIVRVPLPGTKLRRGLAARSFLLETFRAMIPERRARPGEDFFSQMCAAEDDAGRAWSEQEVLDHFNFLMMAAHDTTAASLAKVVWALAAHPDLQERVQAEIDGLPDGPADDDTLAALKLTDRVFREALRLLPPAPFIPRRAVRAFEWQGARIPAGSHVGVQPSMVHLSPAHWTRPDRFDPDRFAPDRAEDRSHRYAWAPFGGGAHKCIGLHFASMQVKLFLLHLLRRNSVSLAQQDPVRWKQVPIPQPIGGLPVRLTRRRPGIASV